MAHKGKLSKSEVLYFPAAVINQSGDGRIGASCGRCMMYMPDKKSCMGVHYDGNKDDFRVSASMGVCAWMGPGKPMNSSAHHKSMPILPRSIAGYQETGPTYCGICVHYEGKRKNGSTGTCHKVGKKTDFGGEMVEFGGCCNSQESITG